MWKSDVFTSLEDKMELNIKGYCESGVFSLVGITETNEEKSVYSQSLSGEFDISYEFDPVSLAIYSAVNKLYLQISGECQVSDWSVTEIIGNISDNADVTVLAENTSAKKDVFFKPENVLFVGNSILLGMFQSYGMCATDNKSDYAYRVSEKILERSPGCKFSKLYVSPFEHCENAEAFDEWFYNTVNPTTNTTTKECFTEELDLIILQIMDNVNTPEKKNAFKDNAPELLKRIKELSPKAKIIWVYGWYMKPDLVPLIKEYVKAYGIKALDISSARKKENESYSGQISTSPSGEKIVVKDTWISHPGNLGMKAIAELILNKLFG